MFDYVRLNGKIIVHRLIIMMNMKHMSGNIQKKDTCFWRNITHRDLIFCLDPETGFEWIGEYDITADELLSGAGGNTATKTEQAERLILDLLADGKELASEDIVKAAAEAGISERTVQNAKRNMGGTVPHWR